MNFIGGVTSKLGIAKKPKGGATGSNQNATTSSPTSAAASSSSASASQAQNEEVKSQALQNQLAGVVGAGGAAQAEKKSNLKKVIKTVVPQLKTSSVQLALIRKAALDELERILLGISGGEKSLVLDPTILGPLALIVPIKMLTDKGVSATYHKIDGNGFESKSQSIIFLCRPRLDMLRLVAKQIQNIKQMNKGAQSDKKFYLYLVPRRTLISEVVLERSGVYGMIEKPIGEFALDLIPVDNDLVSMELPYSLREITLEGDTSTIYHVARGVMKLQSLYGLIQNVKCFGPAALQCYAILEEEKKKVQNLLNFASKIDELVLFDRTVDMVTPFLTPLTYEGLMDELYSIKNNSVVLDFLQDEKKPPAPTPQAGSTPAPAAPTPAMRKVLNDDDEIFKKIRFKHFLSVGTELREQIDVVNKKIEERKNLSNKSVQEIQDYFYKLPQLTQTRDDLATHINIATAIKQETQKLSFRKQIETEQNILLELEDKQSVAFIEDCIIRQEPLSKVLRLMCLYSIIKNGFPASEFDHLRKELVHSYGHFVLLTLHNMELAGFLKRYGSNISRNLTQWYKWNKLRDYLQLIDMKVDERDPISAAFVHSGYAPLSVRLIELAMHTQLVKEAKENKLGKAAQATAETAETKQQDERTKQQLQQFNITMDQVKYQTNVCAYEEKVQTQHSSANKQKVCLVVFIGGCTWSEIHALKFLCTQKQNGIVPNGGTVKYIVATTKIINGNSILTPLFETVA